MQIFKHQTIKSKLMFIILLITGFAIGAGFTFVIFHEIKAYKQELVNNIKLEASLIGKYCVIPLSFYDKKEAVDILSGIETNPSILNSLLYDEKGELFADYHKAGETFYPQKIGNTDFVRFEKNRLLVSQIIIYNNQKYGRIVLRVSTDEIYRKIFSYIRTIFCLAIVIIFFSVFIASRLQRIISVPILTLAKISKKITEEGNYSLRVKKYAPDEIGFLYDEFNKFLNQIQNYIKEIEESRTLLREGKEKLDITLRSMGDGMIATDIKGNIELMNKVSEYLTGWTQIEAQNKPFGDIFVIFDKKTGLSLDDALDKIIEKGNKVEISENVILQSRSGKNWDIAFSGAPIRSEQGEMNGVVLVFRDVSEKIRVEQELKYAQEQLLRKEKLAVIGQLASSVSHELRNPLGVINNSAYYLKMKLKNADNSVQNYIQLLQKEVMRANKIITDLLDFSKTRLPDFKSVDVNALIVESLERISYPKNITVQYKLSNDLPEAIADPDQICQVILNVFNNAVQAMSEGGEIEIESGIYQDNVQIIVKDSGHGIPEECIEKIFDPLYSDKTSGIGLGLSIVKDIIDKHKGKIIVDSKVNIGTVFKILLPVKNTA